MIPSERQKLNIEKKMSIYDVLNQNYLIFFFLNQQNGYKSTRKGEWNFVSFCIVLKNIIALYDQI